MKEEFDRDFQPVLESISLLERLHGLEEPVIHRDIKPENIIFTRRGSRD